MSHRRRKKSVKVREPEDLLGVIAANEHVRTAGRFVQGSVNESVRFLLSSSAFFAFVNVVSPWTNRFADKLPFLGWGILSLALFFVHLKYSE